MAKFRYLGKSVAGEVEDEHGNIVPNILESTDVYGHTFHSRRYTEVSEDEVCSWSHIPYSIYRKNYIREHNKLPDIPEPPDGMIDLPVYTVAKLRGNREFEEQTEEQGEDA